ncbi:hypothetical protein Dimus_025874 [Dionaea muscipula]
MLFIRRVIVVNQKWPTSPSSLRRAITTLLRSTQLDNHNPEQEVDDDPEPEPEPETQLPTSAHYDVLVNEAGRSGNFARVRYLLTKRIHDGCFNSNDTFKFITGTPSHLSQLDSLFDTIASLPKGFIRKCASDSFVARLCKLRLTDDALKVLDKMRERGGMELNACSFHPLLNALTKQKEMGKAWDVIVVYMKEAGVLPDTTAYNYLLTGYCCRGDVRSAADVLTKMREEGLRGDKRTYDAMVLGACRAGKMDGAMAIMRAAAEEEDRVPALLYSTHAHVITALLKMGCYEQAVKFVLCYAGKDTGLDSHNFGLLATHFIKLEKFAHAKLLLDEIKARGNLRMDAKLIEQLNSYQLHL